MPVRCTTCLPADSQKSSCLSKGQTWPPLVMMINSTKALHSRSLHEWLFVSNESFLRPKVATSLLFSLCLGVHPVGELLGLFSLIFTTEPWRIAAWHETTIRIPSIPRVSHRSEVGSLKFCVSKKCAVCIGICIDCARVMARTEQSMCITWLLSYLLWSIGSLVGWLDWRIKKPLMPRLTFSTVCLCLPEVICPLAFLKNSTRRPWGKLL